MSEKASPTLSNGEVVKTRPLEVESLGDQIESTRSSLAAETKGPKSRWDDSGRQLITDIATTDTVDPKTGVRSPKTVGDIIAEVAKGHSEEHPINISGWHKAILDKVGGWVSDIPIKFGKESDFTSQTSVAVFEPKQGYFGSILLHPNNFKYQGNWHVLTHEIVHAATYTAINTFKRHPAVVGLGAIYKHLMQEGFALKDPVFQGLVSKYGMTNLHEFITEVFTNSEFQKDLARIKLPEMLIKKLDLLHDEAFNINPILATKPGKFRSFLDATLGFIADLLGFNPHQTSAFMQSFRMGWDLMEGTASDMNRRINTENKAREAGYPYISSDLIRPKSKAEEKTSAAIELEPQETTSSFLDGIDKQVSEGAKIGKASYVFGLSSESFRTVNRVLNKGATLADKILHHVGLKIREAMQYENSLNHAARETIKAYSQHYARFGGLVNKIDLFKHDMKILVDIEKDPSKWRLNPEQWYPTQDQMIQLGMSPESAKVWAGMHTLWGKAWDTLSNRARENGVTIPERIPGYIPHFFRGAYAVVVKLVDIHDASNKIPYHEYNFDNKQQYQPS